MSTDAEKIRQMWQEAGGLIPAQVAATLLQLRSTGTVTKWMDKRKLTTYTLPGSKVRMLSYAEVVKLANKLENERTPRNIA